MKRTTARLLLSIFMVVLSFSVVFGEDNPKKTSGPDSDDPAHPSHYAKRESAARNFGSWWNDHSGYLIVPRSIIYTGRIANREDVFKLLLMVGYRGDLEDVIRISAINELRRMGPSAIRLIGEIVNGQSLPPRNLFPPGVRTSSLRTSAAYALGELGLEDGIPYLARALDSDDVSLRATCAVSIGKLGGLEHLSRLIEEFEKTERSRDPYIRSAYLASLALLSDPRVLPDLISYLGDRDSRVRASLATALGLLSEEAGSRVIMHYLRENGNSQPIRLAGVWALSEIARRHHGRENRKQYEGELQLIERELNMFAMHENNELSRCNIALAIGHMGSNRSESILNSMLYDANFSVRACAASGLKLMGRDLLANPVIADDPELVEYAAILNDCQRKIDANDIITALPTINTAIKNLKARGQDAAAAGLLPMLGRSFLPGGVRILEVSANSDSQIIAEVALISLGMIRENTDVKRTVPTLQKLATCVRGDVDFTDRASALATVSLGMLDSDKPLNFLKGMLKSPGRNGSASVSSISAAISLSLLGGLPYREPLMELLKSDMNPAVKSSAVFSLGLIRSPGVLETLIDVLQRESNIDLRVNACFALALLKDKAVQPVLYSVMTDSKLARSADGNYLRGCAALALSRTEPSRTYMIELRRQLAATDDENFISFAALALGLYADESLLEALLPLLDSPSRQVREAACLGLGYAGNVTYLPELCDLLTSRADSNTRISAAIACGLLGEVSAIDSLCAMLSPANEGSSAGRAGAALGLALLGSNRSSVLSKLAETSKDPDPRVRKVGALARFVLGDSTSLDPLVAYLASSGMDFMKLDSNLLRDWANSQLPPFIKLRSHLFE